MNEVNTRDERGNSSLSFTQSESLRKRALAVEACSLFRFQVGMRPWVSGAGAEAFVYRALFFLHCFRSRVFCALPSAIVCHCMLYGASAPPQAGCTL
jgi:hypothetical protein